VKRERLLPVLFLAILTAPAVAGAPADRVSLNADARLMDPPQWLAQISSQTLTPIVLAGPVGGRRADYLFSDELLGDVLDDLCSFYGCAWSRQGEVVVLKSGFQARGIPVRLAAWLEKRRKAEKVLPSLKELSILSAYPDEVLREAERMWAQASRAARDPLPYRLLDSLTPPQAVKAAKGGLPREELTESQLALVEKLVKARGEAWEWGEGAVLEFVTKQGEVDPSTGPAGLRLYLKTGAEGEAQTERTLPLVSQVLKESDPAYPQLPPRPDQAEEPGLCELTVSDGKVYADARNTTLKEFLEGFSAATGEKWAAEWALQDLPIVVLAKAVDRAALMDAIASAADARWSDDSTGGKILMANPPAERRPEPAAGPRELLERLFWAVSLDDAERNMASACDSSLYYETSPITYRRWAVKLLRLVDPGAPDRADRPGELAVDGRLLSEEGLDYLLRVSDRLQWEESLKPVYDRAVIQDPKTAISFTWDGRGNYHLRMYNPDFRDAVESDFGLDAMQSEPTQVLSHFPEQPWFLKFPKRAPDDYLAYLERTRAWRGKLALKHVAPLAFVPESKWLQIRKKVPEFAVVTHGNRRAVQYYAVFDHAMRQRARAKGLSLRECEWTADRLLRAIQVDAKIKFKTWGKDDTALLKTEAGIARSLDLTMEGRTLRFDMPKADELLGEEGCRAP